jgi:hypothetical protein
VTVLRLFRAAVITFQASSAVSASDPVRWFFMVNKRKRSYGARKWMFPFEITLTDSTDWEGALSWHRIHLFGKSSDLTRRTHCHRLSNT